MSQSDYIKYKRVGMILKTDNNTVKQPPVFNEKDYLDYKEFTLENPSDSANINTKITYNRLNLKPRVYQPVWNMDKLVDCSYQKVFPVCKNTQSRTNRVPLSSVYFTPTPQPITIDQYNRRADMKTGCICKLNSIRDKMNVCKCKEGRFGIVR